MAVEEPVSESFWRSVLVCALYLAGVLQVCPDLASYENSICSRQAALVKRDCKPPYQAYAHCYLGCAMCMYGHNYYGLLHLAKYVHQYHTVTILALSPGESDY